MEIIIHGTKGGYRVLYQTKNVPFSIARDVRRIDRNDGTPVKQTAYSLAFVENGCAYSKYVIVRDVERAAVGNVAFTVYIPNDEKLSGADAKAIVDELAQEYSKYIPDGRLEKVNENWSFVSAIASKYDNRLKPNDDEMQSGTQDAAFVYYTTDEELQRYFDAPYQDEYGQFKQVFFVKSDLQGKPENPLNALRNSGIELKNIDLSKYKLIYDSRYHQDGINIAVEVRGNRKRNKEKISREKDELKIIYSKEYYENKIVIGKLYEIDKQFIQIDEINRKVTVNYFKGLTPITKSVRFDIRDEAGKTINNVKISCPTKNPTSDEIMFNGNEIGTNWQIRIDAGDRYELKKISIVPKDVSGTYPIKLKEQKIVVFQAIDNDNGDAIHNFMLEIDRHRKQENQIYFYGNDIRKTWRIRITADGYSSEEKEITPLDETHSVVFKLKKKPVYGMQGNHPKKEEKRYYLEIDKKYGKRSYKGDSIYDYVSNMPNFNVDALFGYKFVKWSDRVNGKYQDYDGYYKAIFKELWYHKLPIWAWIIVIAVIIGTIVFLTFRGKDERKTPTFTSEQITAYVEGDSLFCDTLSYYKENWEKQQPEIPKRGNMFRCIGGKPDSTEYKEWEKIKESIDSAIEKRDLIDKKDFDRLKNQNYSDRQEPFKIAVNKIKSAKNQEIGDYLGDVSAFTLSQIAEKIQYWRNKNDNLDSKIKAYLDGIELKKDTLNQYKQQATDKNLKQRIDSCIKFRGHLNNGQVTELEKMNFAYSNKQQSLKNAMSKINKNNKQHVGNAMNRDSVSKMNLDDIAKFIEEEIQKHNSTTSASEPTGSPPPKATATAANSNDLEKDFFELIHRGSIQMDAYVKLFKKHEKEKGEIVDFLKEIIKDSREFDKFKNKFDSIPKSDKEKINSLDKLKEKLKQYESN